MGKQIPVIKAGSVRGVDGFTDPLRLQGGKLRHAVNLQFQSGRIMTRPAFDYMDTGICGKFRGAVIYRPSMGWAFRPFAPCGSRLAMAVDDVIYVNGAPESGVMCNPMELERPDKPLEFCGREVPKDCSQDVHLFTAENYLVISSPQQNTMWWTGNGELVISPGMVSDTEQVKDSHSHDTFRKEKACNFLINGAGLGIYWNGRIHQQGYLGVYVGDLVTKRGSGDADDVILMEEQSLAVCGPPLSTNSRMGRLLAIEGLPQMGTPNGEGRLIGFYEGGIVDYNTFQFPRADQYSPKGERIAQGWKWKQMVNHNCNVVTASGRYAVGVLPRDMFFRSGFGIHVLSRVLGVEFINDEPVNVISDEVNHILDDDPRELLHGCAAGCWYAGHRWFMTTGMDSGGIFSSSPMADGFVSWNRTWSKTEDKTPLPAWEGVWTIDPGLAGIHKFISTGMRDDTGSFGFICSDADRHLWYGKLIHGGNFDLRGGKRLAIPWALETGRFDMGDTTRSKVVVDARFEGLVRVKGTRITVYVRTDKHPDWRKWKHFTVCEKELKAGEQLHISHPMGNPPDECAEATWFEFRIEGTQAAEITGFDVEFSEGSGKIEQPECLAMQTCVNTNPLTTAL